MKPAGRPRSVSPSLYIRIPVHERDPDSPIHPLPAAARASADMSQSPAGGSEMAAEKTMKCPTCGCGCGSYQAAAAASPWTDFFSVIMDWCRRRMEDWWVRLQIIVAITYVAGMLSVIEPCLENLGPILFILFIQVPMIVMLFQLDLSD